MQNFVTDFMTRLFHVHGEKSVNKGQQWPLNRPCRNGILRVDREVPRLMRAASDTGGWATPILDRTTV
jgi:hypothetical protein